MQVGDQVLAINGVSTSGPNTDGSGIFDILLATPYKRLYWQLLSNTSAASVLGLKAAGGSSLITLSAGP